MNNFQKACEMSLNDWLSTLPDIVPEAEYTKKHEKWKKNLFNKMRGDYYHNFTTRTVKLIIIAAILSTFLLTAFAFPSSREFIIENFDIFSRYKITENNKNSVNDEIVVGYIPEEFELVEKYADNKGVIYKYVSIKNEFFTILKNSSSIEVCFNTEIIYEEDIKIDRKTYTYYVGKNNCGYLIWNQNDYVYQVYGEISKEELLNIAKTVT